MNMPKRILVATDFGGPATAALEWAVALAKTVGAKVMVVHAYEIPSYSYPDVAVPVPPEMEREIEKAARHSLAAACERFADGGVEIESVVCRGKAWSEIERVADERHADLLVLGTHARGPLARVFLGSVAEKVVRTSHRPVLVVPSKAK